MEGPLKKRKEFKHEGTTHAAACCASCKEPKVLYSSHIDDKFAMQCEECISRKKTEYTIIVMDTEDSPAVFKVLCLGFFLLSESQVPSEEATPEILETMKHWDKNGEKFDEIIRSWYLKYQVLVPHGTLLGPCRFFMFRNFM